jgi:hypothetical protein
LISLEFYLNRFAASPGLQRAAIVLVALGLGPFTHAQQSSQSPVTSHAPVPTLNVTSRLVLVDVVVTDKNGNPVTDLTKDDVAIYEDKAPERVVSFEPPSSHTLPAGNAVVSFDPDEQKALDSRL